MIRIIAVSYGGASDLSSYLATLRAQSYREWELVIVNNLDTVREHETLGRLAQVDDRIQVLSPRVNLGYLGAARYAFSRCTPQAEWTILSNTDIGFDEGALLHIVGSADRSTPTGLDVPAVLAPSIISSLTKLDQNPFMATRPSRIRMWLRFVLLHNPVQVQAAIAVKSLIQILRGHHLKMEAASQLNQPIYAPHGSLMVFHESYFEGGADLDYPLHLFGEELFVANQCHQYGLRVMYVPSIRVRHREHAQTGTLRTWPMLRKTSIAAAYAYKNYF